VIGEKESRSLEEGGGEVNRMQQLDGWGLREEGRNTSIKQAAFVIAIW
jgi:hypothetical protein